MSTAVKEKKAIGVLPYKWLGGKRWALKFVQPLWNWYRESTDDPVYQDLTVGGGALPLLLGVEDAELSDASAHLIASWKWLKRSGVTSIDFRNTSDEYYQMRTEYNRLFKLFGYSYDGSESQRRALGEMFWHLNRSSRSGIWRVNRSDEFNVPFGDRKKLSEPDLQSIRQAIQGWKFQ
ncbi:MAG: DNA adenine methylase, partial [Cyanobacteria bacterium J06633_2]